MMPRRNINTPRTSNTRRRHSTNWSVATNGTTHDSVRSVETWSSSESSSLPSLIKVAVRLRPMNDKDKRHSTLPVIKASTDDHSVTVIRGHHAQRSKKVFHFDDVFTAFATQEEIFSATLKQMIPDILQGYESTIFAYGQTGTGKTHTMEGSLTSPELYGLIPRSAEVIFDAARHPDIDSQVVTCSYLEIYNENLRDLLVDTPRRASVIDILERETKLEIMEGPNGPFCRGLKEVEVGSALEVLGLMRKAQQLRKVGKTKMNLHSSRSHCLFTIKVQVNRKLEDGGTLGFCGKLHLVDLAGSESAKSARMDKGKTFSGESTARERERMNINRSLLTLGRVIKLLKDRGAISKKTSASSIRIPYRDSKLTRILKKSLGGRCKTLIIATLSPSITAIEESLSTLNYATAACGIVNKVGRRNAFISIGTSPLLLLDQENSESDVFETRNDMEVRLEYMQTKIKKTQAALAGKHSHQQELINGIETAEADAKKKGEELEKVRKKNQSEKEEAANLFALLREDLAKEKKKRETLSLKQEKAMAELKMTQKKLEHSRQKVRLLKEESNDALQSFGESFATTEDLFKLFFRAAIDDAQTINTTKRFDDAAMPIFADVFSTLDRLRLKTDEMELEGINEISNSIQQLKDAAIAHVGQFVSK